MHYSYNSAFSFCANLRHLAKKKEKEETPKARLEFLNEECTEMMIDGHRVTISMLAKVYKGLIQDLRKTLKELCGGKHLTVNLAELAKGDNPNDRTTGYSPFPDDSEKVMRTIHGFQGQSNIFFSFSGTNKQTNKQNFITPRVVH